MNFPDLEFVHVHQANSQKHAVPSRKLQSLSRVNVLANFEKQNIRSKPMKWSRSNPMLLFTLMRISVE